MKDIVVYLAGRKLGGRLVIRNFKVRYIRNIEASTRSQFAKGNVEL